ncbi:pentatricopeptide repeat-containing protein At2g39620 [Selaginella moellendorffii]|uniref:pentatricopeptide repeat-containing protein At2g39620 n=1 Tax=Selaginella moellendorffii TaxID=88036 RepID=UPI000D1D0562|nr:pentatricopeptide repeat-containing protein At2g39620 [Selaginella moellendorffii]|eukprot:XP_024541838.1 pentatricopeptide repeat-containing protein At2g39620 [Selaginella moellendorffii]
MSGERDATAIAISSHASILRDCASARDLTAAKQAQWEIARDGFGGDRYLGNLLVQAYGKCGSVRDAREVFDRIQRRNIFSWTIMLGAYADNGHGREALGLFREIQSRGMAIDNVTLVSALKACAVAGDLEEGRGIHASARSLGYESEIIVATALVSMYGKCGHLEEAKAVFATLVERNRVSWNAMLAAYAQNGHCEEAVRLYRLMCFEGIKPDATTFVSVLDGWKGEGEHGTRIHDQVLESGFGSNTTLANALVSMYGSGGRVDDARYVFDGIAEKTVVSWNAMLTAYAQNGRYGKAVDLFWKMDVAPDSVSFVNVLGACMDIEEGRLVHEYIKASGFPVDVLVSTSLVNMYGRFLRLEEAKQCFEQARERDRVCWNSMVGAYAQNGCGLEALHLYQEMRRALVEPNSVTFVNLLVACAATGFLEAGRKIHAEVASLGLLSTLSVGGALINMYSECGDLDGAVQVFKEMRQLGVMPWDALIAAFAHNKFVREAIYLFSRMSLEGQKPNELTIVSILDACSSGGAVKQGSAFHRCIGVSSSGLDVSNSLVNMYGDGDGKEALGVHQKMELEGLKPDKFTFISVLHACSASEALAEGKAIHALIAASGFDSSCFVATTLIKMYGCCRCMEEAKAVFDRVASKDIVLWTALLTAYSRNEDAKGALLVYRNMDLEGMEKNRFTFSSIVSVCADAEALAEGQKVHLHTVSVGYDKDVIVGTTLVDFYSKCHDVDTARSVFDGIEGKDIVTWNVMITGFARNGHGGEAVRLYQKMDLPPDSLTMVGVLAACSGLGALETGEVLLERSGLERDEAIGTALINLYGKCGSLEQARNVFLDMKSRRNLVTWNSMLAAACTKGGLEDCVEIIHMMGLEGIMPDELTFLSVLFACSHGGSIQQGLDLFLSAGVDYGIATNTKHYVCVVDILGRVGRLEEAQEVLNRMPFQANDVAWMTLLGACRIHRDFEQGRRAADYVIELDPQNAAPYALLSTMFSVAGRGRMPAKG